VSECIYRQLRLPALQNVSYASRTAAREATLADVELVQDARSGLVYNRCFDTALLVYDDAYQNEQAGSALFRRHLASVLSIVGRHVGSLARIVEIGCGKGYFLDMMQDAGLGPTGFDPAYEGTNPRVQKREFAPDDAAACDLIILRHVLEHIPAPFDFLAALAARSAPGTRIYVEVPCFDWIVAHRAFYDIFFEHCNYFTLNVLRRTFGSVRETGHLFGDQYLYVVADLDSFRMPLAYDGPRYKSLDFLDAVNAALQRSPAGHPPIIWGAGAKGMTLSNILYRRGASPAGLVDINPAKQSRFVGMSALPIYAPRDAMSLIEDGHEVYVMNPNYLDEILALFPRIDVRYRCLA
jgi:hypothetical protein